MCLCPTSRADPPVVGVVQEVQVGQLPQILWNGAVELHSRSGSNKHGDSGLPVKGDLQDAIHMHWSQAGRSCRLSLFWSSTGSCQQLPCRWTCLSSLQGREHPCCSSNEDKQIGAEPYMISTDFHLPQLAQVADEFGDGASQLQAGDNQHPTA